MHPHFHQTPRVVCSISMTITYTTLDPSPVTNIQAGLERCPLREAQAQIIEILQVPQVAT